MRTLKMNKFMEVNTMNIFKKTNNKETKKLPMTGKVIFSAYFLKQL